MLGAIHAAIDIGVTYADELKTQAAPTRNGHRAEFVRLVALSASLKR